MRTSFWRPLAGSGSTVTSSFSSSRCRVFVMAPLVTWNARARRPGVASLSTRTNQLSTENCATVSPCGSARCMRFEASWAMMFTSRKNS